MAFLKGLRLRSASEPEMPRRRSSASNASPLPALSESLSKPSSTKQTTQKVQNSFNRSLSTSVLNDPPGYLLQLPPARFPILPRDEEGAEPLPPYTSSILRATVLSRKLELLSPMETSPNRSWQSVIVVLNNTQLNFYKAPLSAHPPPLPTPPATISLTATKVASVLPWRSASLSSSSSGSDSQVYSTSLPSNLHQGIDDTIDPYRLSPISSSTSSTSSSLESLSSATSATTKTPSLAASLGLHESAFDPVHLIRSYTLQYAQVGLATDYRKRQNVIRVRAEGQQFLLLCSDPRETVEWTSAMQAACDLALPLDERTIPRYRSIPSRRRRRILPSARHPTATSIARRREELAEAISAPASSVAQIDPTFHDEDEEEDGELYYRQNNETGSFVANTDGVAPHDDHDDHDDHNEHDGHDHGEHEIHDDVHESGDEERNEVQDNLTDLPSSLASFSFNRPRRDSIPRSFTTYDDDNVKWAPPSPQSSSGSKLRYAVRCLYTLPSNSSWGDKLLMTKGDHFVIRERVLA
ncbi:hypothetical protein V1512DRAFT_256923 [Lipomyces arxii]|uniref:uncharacterized protein n=1 Tax=Lipomyces arxii TaxID=56418 RepID=UPI0034CD1938